METYEIIRFYSPADGRENETIKSGLTLDEAREHCRDPRTREDGVYFDGFRGE